MAKKKALAWSPIRALMKSVGAQIVARDAVDLVVKWASEKITAITTKAMRLTTHSKRTTISKDDIELALKM